MPKRHALSIGSEALPVSTAAAGVHDEVLRINDLTRVLKVSRRTICRLRSENSFPIPEITGLDNRPRWSRVMVDRFLAGERVRRSTLQPRHLPSATKANRTARRPRR